MSREKDIELAAALDALEAFCEKNKYAWQVGKDLNGLYYSAIINVLMIKSNDLTQAIRDLMIVVSSSHGK